MAQQVPDTAYNPAAFNARYAIGKGTTIIIDEAHHNFHTADGRYAPFAKLLAKDGYRIEKGTKAFSEKSLKGRKILVISNPVHESNMSQWALPNPSAFTKDEINAVKDWVTAGGSLFLIADHMPFAGAAADLAQAFGFKFYNGFAVDTANDHKPDIFSRFNKRFNANALLGLDGIDSIATFTGQAFDLPAGAESILDLDRRFQLWMPQMAWEFDEKTERISAAGKSQGACLKFGKGRVVVFGEAAMFSAQLAGPTRQGTGMNTQEGAQNYKLLLAIIHWLDDAR